MIIIWLKQLLKKPRYFFVAYQTPTLFGNINIRVNNGIFNTKEVLAFIDIKDTIITSVFEMTEKEYKKAMYE